ncbi:hypothetical protein Achl_4477 (plasmid) [Pseudarthrobacter chlorophenolicus A6]|uniref:Uncharacterized protein n=1 Tax=Pseudarthrobacter chlorophenolicus (strain ATCC 700700 / DSM 12829 / CIP 107037 / JCM 12360 / KCTC 9906 / NCIMB 13794 / A6) TaxID=452863 RepID=B8HJ31_PSECP|nr:hypothetical protein [Pseudarthrobacter chlorophenolicus]ACL42428.1 hypothetical protein Achl_4477 [Pseudarthrobacter chlorophenolicus A6]SDQ17997.1 hypothetical protein SAMN04489738_0534 [Pseudarthrobacter chlorophenolicus]
MTTFSMTSPADIAAHTSAAVRSLTDEQLTAVMVSARKVRKRRLNLPGRWSKVREASPDLADALDDLHSEQATNDLPRFEALAARSEVQRAREIHGPIGQLTALAVLGASLSGLLTAILGLTQVITLAVIIGGATVTVGLLAAAYVGGLRLAKNSATWMFVDPEAAAAIVWDAGIDAAAAVALQDASGLTTEDLSALRAVWVGAGLDTSGLTSPGVPTPFALPSTTQA